MISYINDVDSLIALNEAFHGYFESADSQLDAGLRGLIADKIPWMSQHCTAWNTVLLVSKYMQLGLHQDATKSIPVTSLCQPEMLSHIPLMPQQDLKLFNCLVPPDTPTLTPIVRPRPDHRGFSFNPVLDYEGHVNRVNVPPSMYVDRMDAKIDFSTLRCRSFTDQAEIEARDLVQLIRGLEDLETWDTGDLVLIQDDNEPGITLFRLIERKNGILDIDNEFRFTLQNIGDDHSNISMTFPVTNGFVLSISHNGDNYETYFLSYSRRALFYLCSLEITACVDLDGLLYVNLSGPFFGKKWSGNVTALFVDLESVRLMKSRDENSENSDLTIYSTTTHLITSRTFNLQNLSGWRPEPGNCHILRAQNNDVIDLKAGVHYRSGIAKKDWQVIVPGFSPKGRLQGWVFKRKRLQSIYDQCEAQKKVGKAPEEWEIV